MFDVYIIFENMLRMKVWRVNSMHINYFINLDITFIGTQNL